MAQTAAQVSEGRNTSRPTTSHATGATSSSVQPLVFRLLQQLLPQRDKTRLLTRMAMERLARTARAYSLDGHTTAYAVLDTVREICFDNLTSAAWSETPFSTCRDKLDDLALPPRLPESAFPPPPASAPKGLATYLASTLPLEIQLLFQFVLYHGCRPEEVDLLFALDRGTTACVLAQQLFALGAVHADGHAGGDQCWPTAYLRFATKTKKPACRSCRRTAIRVQQLAALFSPPTKKQEEGTTQALPQRKRKRTSRKVRALKSKEIADSSGNWRRRLVTAISLLCLVVAFAHGLELRSATTNTKNETGRQLSSRLPEGTVAHSKGRGQLFSADDEICAEDGKPRTLFHMSGARCILRPGAIVRMGRHHVALVSGTVFIDTQAISDDIFTIRCDYFAAPLTLGRYWASCAAATASLAVQRGSAKVTLASVIAYTVPAGKQATVDGEGEIHIADLDDERQPSWLLDTEPAAAAMPTLNQQQASRHGRVDRQLRATDRSAKPTLQCARHEATKDRTGRSQFYRHLF